MDAAAVRLTCTLAAATTAVLALVGLPLAHWLAMSRWRGRFLVESLVTLPLVLPPTVLGFFILVGLGPQSPVGRWYEQATGASLPFSFAGILVASVISNLPFAVRPFTAAFTGMDRRLVEASWCLGESRWRTWWRVTLPACWPGILAGLVLTFAHAVGEFGVVLMVGGSIPGVTRTLALTMYDDVQALDYAAAARTSVWLVAFALAAMAVVHLLEQRRGTR